jgi:hypothetical protein
VLLGTSWELDEPFGNMKKNKNFPLPPKREKWIPRDYMLSLFIDDMKLLFPKLFVTIFGLG